MTDLDIQYEAQEALRYLDLDSNTMGTKDNQIANAINARELQKANDKKASVQLAQGILRPRHNVDVAFAVDEKIRRRRGLYAPNATVANNSEKFNSGDDRILPQLENNKKEVVLPSVKRNVIEVEGDISDAKAAELVKEYKQKHAAEAGKDNNKGQTYYIVVKNSNKRGL